MSGAAASVPVLGGFIGAAGASQAAAGQAAADNFNAYINNVNSDMATYQGQQEERQSRVYSSMQIGQERADYGSAGVSSSTGSAVDVLGQSAKQAELDALNIRHSADFKSWGYKMGATLDEMGAANATKAGQYSAAASIFNGFSNSARFF